METLNMEHPAYGNRLPADAYVAPPIKPLSSLSEEPAGGRKDDYGKIRLDLIPSEVVFALGSVLTFGAEKYNARNWEKGMNWGRVFGALMRHMWAWWAGKGPTTKSFLFGSVDGETSYSHLWHAACCITFLITFEERKVGFDDRTTT